MKSIEDKVEDLLKKNIIADITDKNTLIKLLKEKKLKIYVGIDPTNDKFHIGHLALYSTIMQFLKLGAKLVILVGGFTGQIGDPSFSNKERPILQENTIDQYTNIFMKKLQYLFRDYTDVQFINNKDWLNSLTLKDFLGYAKCISANRLVKMEHIKNRLEGEAHISFSELCYSLLQGIDFLYLFQEQNVTCQFGATDQFINILTGIRMIKYFTKNEDIIGMSIPLLTKKNGEKFSKSSEEGVIWADGSLPIFQFWQFLRNIDDELLVHFLHVFTDVEDTSQVMESDNSINEYKTLLANHITHLVYGHVNLTEEYKISQNISIIDLLVELNFLSSKTSAKEALSNGSVKINNNKITENIFINQELFQHLLQHHDEVLLAYGKFKKIKLINVISDNINRM